MKRRLALFLALIMVLGMLPVNAFAATDAVKPVPKNDKTYEEATIDGRPYKVYKLADLMDKPSKERPMTLKRMARSTNLAKAQDAPAQPYDGWKFYLNLVWETIDRPINNATMPVYFGNPTDPRAIKLGHFIVTTGANEDQYIEMVQEYFGTQPSIDFLVENGYSNITIATPNDMLYDFILASTKWDKKDKVGTAGVDHRVVFKVEGRQNVMHGYGIRWFDNDPANRDKIAARWEGKENQTSDVKLGIKDRDYSVYSNNVLDTNDKSNVKKYQAGEYLVGEFPIAHYEDKDQEDIRYSNYDYYYNGKKVTTYADANNKGKYDNELLAIASKDQAPTASLTVDGKRSGEKVLKNNTKYLYNSVGDYRTFHVLSMREALKVMLNSGAGMVGTEANKDLTVNGKDFQEIGHSEKIKDNESGRKIDFSAGNTITAPKVKIGGKEVDATFAGWATEPQTLTDGKLSPIKGQLVDASGNLTEAGKTYTFKEKETTLYAVFTSEEEGAATVKYVYVTDDSKTKLSEKYAAIPGSTEGKIYGSTKDKVSLTFNESNKAPTFTGYKLLDKNAVVVDPKDATYEKDEAGANLPTVYVVYEKVEKKAVTNKFVDGSGNALPTLPADNADQFPEVPKNPDPQSVGAQPDVPAQPTKTTVNVTTGDNQGTWTFDGWYAGTIDAKNKNKKLTVSEKGPNEYIGKWTFKAIEKSPVPDINPVKPDDKQITGKGTPESEIKVTIPGVNDPKKVTVDKDGNWKVEVPDNIHLKDGDVITATQKTGDLKESDPAKVTVERERKGGFFFFPAAEEEKPETAIHKAYIFGYEDDSFKPEGNMTRAEAAAMLARLQGLDLSNDARPDFMDVRSGWYNGSINAVVSAGYMKGYPDNTFRPNGKITRAEFAQMIKAIDKANTGVAPFADVKGHWAEAAINQAYANGRIAGYPDSTFRPNNNITRAEAVTVFNKLYDRSVSEAGLVNVKNSLVDFNDISRGHWAYYQVVEASNTHEYYRTVKGKVDETWVKILQTWKDILAHR